MALKHCGTVRLETGRLILRQFTITDAEVMYKNWASYPEVTKYLTWPSHVNVAVSKAVLEGWINRMIRKTITSGQLS